MMERVGPSIFWLPMLIGDTEVPVPIRTWVVILGGILTVFLSIVIFPAVYFQYTTVGSLGTAAALHVAPVTISLSRTSHTTCKAHPLVATPAMVVWSTSRMTPCMITGISLFVNNLCGLFPLVVSLSVIFFCFYHQFE